MASTRTPEQAPAPEVERPPTTRPTEPTTEEDRSGRRLLVVLLWVLAIAAIALLALLLWLLWPKPSPTPAQAAGYPIQVVTTIYGYGDAPDEQLKTPLGVAFDGEGHVWIANTGRSRVEEYTTDGAFVRQVGGEPGPGQLSAPYGIAVDPSTDRVYVADFGAGAVEIYTTSGAYAGRLPAGRVKVKAFGDGFSPYAVRVVGGRVVVSSNDGLYFFDQSGRLVDRWVGTAGGRQVRGGQFGQFNFPDSFAVDPKSGTFYVADTMNRRVVAIGPAGRWLWVSGTPDVEGRITGFWQLPRSIEVGPDGRIYVVDTFRPDPEGMGTGHIVVLSQQGQLLSEFGRSGYQDGAFAYPDQLAFDSHDLWAIADRENDRVVIFRLRTPYPPPSQIEASKYAGAISNPTDTWSGSRSEPPTTPSPSA